MTTPALFGDWHFQQAIGRAVGWVLRDLLRRLATEPAPHGEDTCFGGYLSRCQYAFDFEHLGMKDPREAPQP